MHCRRNRGMPAAVVKGSIERPDSEKKRTLSLWRFYNAVNKELSPNPFLAKSQVPHQRSVRLLSPALFLYPLCVRSNMRCFIENNKYS